MKRTVPTLIAASTVALALSGCSASADSGDAEGLTLVASTNVYADIAQSIAGDRVEVTAIIDSSVQDPHSYEASASDRLAVTKADVVIENGGGYDSFMDSLIGEANPVILNASEISGLMPEDAGEDHGHDEHAHESDDHEGHDHIEGFNEHVWYSIDAMDRLAKHIVEELTELDGTGAETFQSNYDAFADRISGLQESLLAIEEAHGGESVLITEPVPLYLLEGAGLQNETPEEFSEAVEEGNDVSPTVLNDVIKLVDSGDIALLAYNEQTSGRVTDEVKEAAEAADVPVVSFSETLPDDTGYLDWMNDNIEAVSEALSA
ncbi:metal ABC transporter substrate-binding protein [Paramicrobacterium sp. CJ85]|uniref:metal ABC transporter substrate-binding protein n=1 Tax=Paramicrobacterium sp. CJ85 TaxID=3445355 RepID=UPI003F5EF52F